MKALIVSIILILLFIPTSYSQSKEAKGITVEIRRVSKKETNKDAGIEIELTTSASKGFYVGEFIWCLRIGDNPGITLGSLRYYTKDGKPSAKIIPDHRKLLYGFTKKEWKKMKNGDPIYLTWGCKNPSEELKPFAFLNKKILKK